MRFEPHRRPWALALMVGLLWTTGGGCRRFTSPEVDVRPQSLELRDILVDVVWPDEAVTNAIRVRYTNEPFVDFDDPRRSYETFDAEKDGSLLLVDRPLTRFLLLADWENTDGADREWWFGPFEVTNAPLRLDLRTPNLSLVPRLSRLGVGQSVEEVSGRVSTERFEGRSGFSAHVDGDSVLAFRLPSMKPPLSLYWTLAANPGRVQQVTAQFQGAVALGDRLEMELDLFPVFVRINSLLPPDLGDRGPIDLRCPGSGDWTQIETSTDWAPGEVVELWTRESPVDIDAALPFDWRPVVAFDRQWFEVAPGDTVDFDVGVLDLRVRCLAQDGSPIAHTPVELDVVGTYGGLNRVTDGDGDVGFLVNPGTYHLDVAGAWERTFEVQSDTLVVLRETP